MNPFAFIDFPKLSTDRLILRQITYKDIDVLYDIYKREDVMIYFGIFPVKKKDQIENMIRQYEISFHQKNSIRWGLFLKETEELIGSCGFHNWNKGFSRAEIGYELHPNYWNKGLMSEALREILRFGYYEMALNRIEALVYPENKNSNNLLEKLGFKNEGMLKEYAYFRNKYQDLNIYSLLRKDFFKEDNVILLEKDDNRKLKYVVIQAATKDGWIFAKHKNRDTLEIPGGHIEAFETANEAAERELNEETGAIEFDLFSICDYGVNRNGNITYGRLYYAEVSKLEELKHEIEEIYIKKMYPKDTTYPTIQPLLYREVLMRSWIRINDWRGMKIR